MWQYVKRYAHFAFIAALFMGGEVLMDLIQPGLMRRIVDDGVLGLNNNGVGNLELVWRLGIQMIGMVLIGCCFGSLNNVFVNMASQNLGNDLRKDTFRHTAATFLLSQGEPVQEVSRIMGHSDPTVTYKLYCHAVPGYNQTMISRFRKRAKEANKSKNKPKKALKR